MTGSVSYPSEQFPAFPPVSLSLPEGWQPITSPAVLLAVGAEPQEGQFRANVVVTATRFPPGLSLATATEMIVDKFIGLPGLAEIGREGHTVLGQPGFRYEASYSDQRVGALVQVVHLTVFDRGVVTDLVQVTATCTGEQALSILPQLRAIADSAVTS